MGECALCGVQPLEMRPGTPEYLAVLDDEDDDGLRNSSSSDTSQPYPLDALRERIDAVTSERRS